MAVVTRALTYDALPARMLAVLSGEPRKTRELVGLLVERWPKFADTDETRFCITLADLVRRGLAHDGDTEGRDNAWTITREGEAMLNRVWDIEHSSRNDLRSARRKAA